MNPIPKGKDLLHHEEDFSRNGATTQSATAFRRVFVAPLRRCARTFLCIGRQM